MNKDFSFTDPLNWNKEMSEMCVNHYKFINNTYFLHDKKRNKKQSLNQVIQYSFASVTFANIVAKIKLIY